MVGSWWWAGIKKQQMPAAQLPFVLSLSHKFPRHSSYTAISLCTSWRIALPTTPAPPWFVNVAAFSHTWGARVPSMVALSLSYLFYLQFVYKPSSNKPTPSTSFLSATPSRATLGQRLTPSFVPANLTEQLLCGTSD
jgi:hypothetical protein